MSADEEPNADVESSGGVHDVLRNEARQVLNAQLRTLRETDRKSMATARVAALLLGLLLSAASLVDTPSESVNGWIVTGTAFVLASLAVAVLTYSVDRPSYGVSPDSIESMLEDDRTATESDLLASYADWIRANGDEIASNGTYLLVSQLLLVLGLAAVAVGMFRLP